MRKSMFFEMECNTFESSSSTMAVPAAVLMMSGCMATELSEDVSALVDAIHFEMP